MGNPVFVVYANYDLLRVAIHLQATLCITVSKALRLSWLGVECKASILLDVQQDVDMQLCRRLLSGRYPLEVVG